MIHLVYRFILYPGRQLYRFLFRPKTRGVKVIIFFDDEVLLIKNSYGRSLWNLPGGGVYKNEVLVDAAKREVFEEVGIRVTQVKQLGSFLNQSEYCKDTVTVYVANVKNNDVLIDHKEVAEVRWFKSNKLPKAQDCTKTLLQSFALLDN